MKEQFYRLMSIYEKKYFQGHILTKLDFNTLAREGMINFKGPLKIEITEGVISGDFLEVGLPPLIVSFKALEVWKSFESFKTYPVLIEGGVSPVEYTGVVFLGKGGPFDPAKSKAVYSKALDEQGKPAIMNYEGMYFDDTHWGGSDLLTIYEFPCVPIVTEKVVKAMKKAKITNCTYTPLEKSCIYKKYTVRKAPK